MARTKNNFPPQARLNLSSGDKVTVDHTRFNKNLVLPEDRDFYGQNVGTILSFLDKPTAPNNGAALVEIKQKYGMVISVYINTNELVKQ